MIYKLTDELSYYNDSDILYLLSGAVDMDQLFASLLPSDAKADAKKYIHENQIPHLFEVSVYP